MMNHELSERIRTHEVMVGVVGMGYVGLPLMMEFAERGIRVLGFDIDPTKVKALSEGRTYIRHIPEERVSKSFIGENARATATSDFSRVGECDAILICVPTPLTKHRDPDLSYIESTAQGIAPYVRRGQLVCLESTTYPGTTEDVLIPILEQGSGLKAGTDFFVAYSPEREDPNNRKYHTSTIPKVVGGLDEASLEVAQGLYDQIICKTIPVSSCRAAEATKLMENIFRCVNIALVNELKVVFAEMGIDIWEVIRAAETKPFGYMPFYPGPGLGGHCIPIDPFYLTWKAREYGLGTKFVELAGEINTAMPRYVVQKTMEALNTVSRSLNGSRVLLVGLAYKKNVDDERESPTYVLWEEFIRHGAIVSYFDPYCPTVRPSRQHGQFAGTPSVAWENISPDQVDIAVICTAHDCVDHEELARKVPQVVDCRGVCTAAPNIFRA